MARILRGTSQPRGSLKPIRSPAGPEAAKIAMLTAREREVMALVGQGLKNRQIAARLSISESIVRQHLSTIFAKLSVVAGLELAIYANRHSLARFPP